MISKYIFKNFTSSQVRLIQIILFMSFINMSLSQPIPVKMKNLQSMTSNFKLTFNNENIKILQVEIDLINEKDYTKLDYLYFYISYKQIQPVNYEISFNPLFETANVYAKGIVDESTRLIKLNLPEDLLFIPKKESKSIFLKFYFDDNRSLDMNIRAGITKNKIYFSNKMDMSINFDLLENQSGLIIYQNFNDVNIYDLVNVYRSNNPLYISIAENNDSIDNFLNFSLFSSNEIKKIKEISVKDKSLNNTKFNSTGKQVQILIFFENQNKNSIFIDYYLFSKDKQDENMIYNSSFSEEEKVFFDSKIHSL